MKWTLTSSQNQTCRKNPDHSGTGWMIECERCWTNPQKKQHKTATNIPYYGKCLWLRHWKHLFSWETNTQKIFRSIKNRGNSLTMKQIFDISEKLIVGQSDEIHGVTPMNWEDPSWKQLSLVGDEEVMSLSQAKVYVFSDSVLCLGKVNQNPTSNTVWVEKLSWFKDSPHYRTLDTLDGEPMEFEWNIFPGFTTLQLCNKVQEFMSKMSDQPEEF